MSLEDLVNHATDKERFHTVEQYIDFCTRYLEKDGVKPDTWYKLSPTGEFIEAEAG